MIIQSSIIILILQGIAQFIGKKEPKRLLLSALLFSAAILQIHFYTLKTKSLIQIPQLFMIYVPILLLAGPLMRLYLYFLSKEKYIFNPLYILHFIPSMVGFLYYFYFFSFSRTDILYLIEFLYSKTEFHIYDIPAFLCSISLTIYAFLIVKENPEFIQKDRFFNKPVLLIWFFINIIFILIMTIYIKNSTISILISHIGNIIVSVVFIVIFLINLRHPNLFIEWLFKIQKMQRTRKYLGGINPEKKLAEIQQVMILEKLYLQENISLQKIAERFNLTRYQLSELLNDYAKMSFHDFVAFYRIEHAKELLLKNPWKKTISIALETGFNSQSMFNRTFKKWVGMTPSMFQKKINPE